MRFTLVVSFIFLPCLGQERLPPPPATQFTGTIEGRLEHPFTDLKIAPRVRAVKLDARPRTSPEASVARDGTFRLTNLPPGEYSICGRIPRRAAVDPCLWGNPISTVRIGSGTSSKGNLVAISRGRTFTVRLRDPQRVLAASDSLVNRPSFSILLSGVTGGRHFPMQAISPEPDGQVYEAVVPATGAFRLVVAAPAVRVGDELGRELSGPALERRIEANASLEGLKLEFRILGKSIAGGK